MEIAEFTKLTKAKMVVEHEKLVKKLTSALTKNDKLIAELSATKQKPKSMITLDMTEEETIRALRKYEHMAKKYKKLKKKLTKNNARNPK